MIGSVGLSLLLTVCWAAALELETYKEWSKIDFQYKSNKRKNADIRSGRYIPEDVIIFGAVIYKGEKGERIFVTTPDVMPGTPFTVSTVTNTTGPGGPVLKPFPSERDHKVKGRCKSITNVWKPQIDSKDRLWLIDNGKINTLRIAEKVCPAQILIYDLKNNDKLVRRYKVPDNPLNPSALYVSMQLEDVDDDTIAYLNDEQGATILVYSFKNNTSFVVNHPYFHPDPYKYPFFQINGVNVTLLFGVDGVALSPPDESGDRWMYFHPLTAGREGRVKTSVIRQAALANDFDTFTNEYEILDDRGYQSSVEQFTPSGKLVFSNVIDNSLIAWDPATPYSPDNFETLIKDDERLQFPSFMYVSQEKDGSHNLVVTTSRAQNFIIGKPLRNQVNYRILVGNVDSI